MSDDTILTTVAESLQFKSSIQRSLLLLLNSLVLVIQSTLGACAGLIKVPAPCQSISIDDKYENPTFAHHLHILS